MKSTIVMILILLIPSSAFARGARSQSINHHESEAAALASNCANKLFEVRKKVETNYGISLHEVLWTTSAYGFSLAPNQRLAMPNHPKLLVRDFIVTWECKTYARHVDSWSVKETFDLF